MEPKTLQSAILYFANPVNCREYLVARRWPNGVTCPKCGSAKVLFLEKYNRWHCREKHPAPQFTLKTGTVMEDSPVGLDKWLTALWMVVNCKNGVSSYEIARSLGLTQKTAWFLDHRIRLALKDGSWTKLGGDGGPVEVDETFVSPDTRKMHADRRRKKQTAEYFKSKPIVMGMLDRDTRKVRAMTIPNVKRETLQTAIMKEIETGSTVYTDEFTGYLNLAAQDYVHETVNHAREYVRGQVHTQGIENFWSLLKRGLTGTYVAVEPFHLDRYIDEQVFRFNTRATKDNPLTDADRFALAVSQMTGKRLTYAELTGKTDEATA
jgi:transposase-like protein